MEKSVQLRLGLIVGAGLASLVITLGGYYWFLQAAWFSTIDGIDKATWGGYTLAQLFGLCLFVLFNPIAFTYLFVAAQTFIRHYADVSTKAVMWTAAACVAICLAFCIYGITNSYYFLECMGIGCYGPDLLALLIHSKSLNNLSLSVYGWKVTIGVSLLLVCLSFAGMYIAVAFRERKLKKDAPADGASVDETERLASSSSSSSSGDVVAPHHPRSAWRWLAYGGYVLAMLIWWVPTTVIPASWEYFEPSRIAYNAAQYATEDSDSCGNSPPRACAELEGATWTTTNIALSEYFVMKIFPSSVIFFMFWIITPGLALLAYDIKFVHRFLQRKLRLCGSSFFSFGEVAAFAIFSLMMVLWSYYWFHDHNFHGRGFTRPMWEKAYRGAGQVAVLLMAVLMLPAARSGILGAFFRVSWEVTIQYHRWVGTLWLVAVVGHIVFYWVYAAMVTGTLAIDWFPLHFTGSLDNFTVPLQIVFTYLAIITIGVFAFFDFFRRKFFELFFYTHHISYCFLILTVLWHASAAWMYLLPPVALWFADRVLRAYRSNRAVKVLQLRARDCGKAGQVVEIECEVAGGMPYKAGQYAFLNVAELSILEWHPFTIASATASRMTFLIKAMGEGEATWTRRLYELARTQESKDGGAVKLTLCVDGPNGEPVDMRQYRSVLLVCGGIGVTPCASLLEALRKQPKPSPSAHLLWVVRDASLCTLLGDRLEGCARPLDADALAAHPEHEQPAATASLFIGGVNTKQPAEHNPVRVAPVPVAAVVEAGAAMEAGLAGAAEEKQAVQARAVARLQHAGRPATDAAWTATLEPLAARAVAGESARETAQRTLLYVCGPNTMIEQMEAIAYAKGWSFHTEVFDL